MNYIKEINAFFDLMEREPLSASAVNLWHTLLHINNKAAWVEEFTVPATVLKLKGGLTDSSFKRARKELEARGLIKCRSTGRNVAPFYTLKRLYKMLQVDHAMNQQTDDQLNQPVDHQASEQVNHHADQHTAPLIKQKEIKQKDTKQKEEDTSDAIAFYQENFGVVSPYVAEELLAWIDDVGDDLVLEAMKRSLERGKVSFGYVKGILKSWVKQGIRSVDRLKMKEPERGNRQRGNMSQEVVPEWFWERKQKKRGVQEDLKEEENVIVRQLLEEYLEEQAG